MGDMTTEPAGIALLALTEANSRQTTELAGRKEADDDCIESWEGGSAQESSGRSLGFSLDNLAGIRALRSTIKDDFEEIIATGLGIGTPVKPEPQEGETDPSPADMITYAAELNQSISVKTSIGTIVSKSASAYTESIGKAIADNIGTSTTFSNELRRAAQGG